jgi:uncharacterized membrane protein
LAYIGAIFVSISIGTSLSVFVTSFISSPGRFVQVVGVATWGIVAIAAFIVLWRFFLRRKAYS